MRCCLRSQNRSKWNYNHFDKIIDGSRLTAVAVDSGGSLDLFIQNMYAGAKKESYGSVTDEASPIITSETSAEIALN